MRLRSLQILVVCLVVVFWYVMTAPGLIPPFYFDKANRAAFFFGEPQKVFWVIVEWFATGEIFGHLGITLLETALGFLIGSVFGLAIGLWLALSPTASAVMDPYIKGFNSMPRVVLAPIFAVWFGLGIWSKVALGVTLVFFVVFFNVYQGVREVSPNLLANARTHTPAGTTVTVSVARDGADAVLRVHDDGPGIDPAISAELFERFSRADRSRARQTGGTGLGLSIVRAIVQAHHGSIHVASRPGDTTFEVRLPTRSESSAAAQ